MRNDTHVPKLPRIQNVGVFTVFPLTIQKLSKQIYPFITRKRSITITSYNYKRKLSSNDKPLEDCEENPVVWPAPKPCCLLRR